MLVSSTFVMYTTADSVCSMSLVTTLKQWLPSEYAEMDHETVHRDFTEVW